MANLGLIEPRPERWPVSLGIVLFGSLFAMACLRYLTLRSTVFDLGIFVCNLTAMANNGEWWRALNGHIQPVLWAYVWVVRALPDWLAPLGLMASQALALALPLPFLGRRYGWIVALAYGLSYAVWHNGLFDFHPDHMVIPLGFLFFFRAQDDRPWAAALAALALCLVKESFALQTAACGLYLMGTRRGGPAGFTTLVIGLVWFWLATAKLIPFFTMDQIVGIDGGAFAWIGGDGLLGKLAFLLTHPLTTLGHVLGDPRKWRYILALLGSLAFLPLLASRPLLVALPTLFLSLLATRPDYYSITNHYTAGLVAPAVMSFAMALRITAGMAWLRRTRLDRLAGLLAAVLVGAHVLLSPSPLSVGFWLRGGPAVYFPSERDTRIIRTLEARLPDSDDVPVVSQNSLNWGKASGRFFHNSFPLAVFEPHRAQDMRGATLAQLARFVATGEKPAFPVTERLAEYIVLDLKRPWFVVDKGCEWRNGACRDPAMAERFLLDVEAARALFDTVVEDDGFLLLKRRHP